MPALTIPLDQFRDLLRRGLNPPLLDVRTPGEYARVHADGARLMPLDGLNPAVIAGEYPDRANPIYVICESGARAAKATEKLRQAGIDKAFSVEGGTAAWQKMGLPVVLGASGVMSIERQVRIAAGALVAVGCLLTMLISRWFLMVPMFVGCGLVFAGISNFCGMGMLLAKLPWNQQKV